MKGNTLKCMGGLVALISLSVFGQTTTSPSVSPKPKPQPVVIGTPSAAISPFSQKVGLGKMMKQGEQDAEVQATAVIPTASQVLANILSETNKVPLEIYPPGFVSNLMYMGDSPMYTAKPFSAADYALKPGDKSNMRWLDATFNMGSPTSEAERNSDESQHTAIISYGFYMANYEVTQNEYQQIMGSNPSYFTPANGYTADLNRPVESVTWAQASAFCAALTTQEQGNWHIASTWQYRLPTEAEWEYSCRGNSTILYSQTDDSHQFSFSSTGSGHDYDTTGWPVSGVTDITIKVGGSGIPGGIYMDTTCADGPHIIGFGVPTSSPSLMHAGNLGGIGFASPSYLYLYYSGSSVSTIVDGAGGSPFVPYMVMQGQGNVSPAFNFGNYIRGGMANFDDHYEYGASGGTVNMTTPVIPALNMTTDVGSYIGSAFDLFDMHGNVSEWCQDYYGAYPSGTLVDYQGASSGNRVVRGGSWADHGAACRSAKRQSVSPSTQSSQIGFRIVLAPITPEWKTAVATQPSIKTYGVPPTKSKDNLVLITHGWIRKDQDPTANTAFIDTMSNSIASYLGTGADWQVYGYRWIPNAHVTLPDDSLSNARQEGIVLGNSLANQGWTHIHFISHSAGAGLIQVATEIIKARSPSTEIHCTFLDPYVGTDFAGQSEYGNGADWADKYSAHGDVIAALGPYTDIPLDSAYNADVTGLDPSLANSGLFSGVAGYVLCSLFESSHGWPITFYQNSITGSPPGYSGFGFPLSKEAGGWPSAPTTYPVGNIASVQVLGTAPAACAHRLEIQTATPVVHINFSTAPNASQSTSGTVTPSADTLTLITGSPAWLSIVPTNTDPVNLISFDANYTSTGTGAAGMLSVLWDADTIGTVDERTVGQGVAHYALHFSVTESNSTHVLSFRLDPFTNVQSTIVITNVVLARQGVTQPFSLSSTTNTLNGAIVWQLTGQAGFDYGLQASIDLASTNWTQIATLQNTNGVVTFFDQDSTNYPMRFYRAVAPY